MSRSCEHSDKECRSCWKQRIGSVGLGAGTTPSRKSRTSISKGETSKNSWEKAIARDDRGMPYLNEQGGPIHVKTLAETRHKYRKHQKATVNSPKPSA